MYRHFFKRTLDIVGSLILLPFVLLEVIILAPFIHFTDGGPVFYNALRKGRKCKTFRMFKLRTMYVNSPDLKNPDGSTYNSAKDPRVTPVGRILRKTSLDEFPQMLNVLIGDMSFIGPRPTLATRPLDYDSLEGDRKKRYSVRPGVTGYAQSLYRNAIPQDEKFRLDAYYVDHLSFLLDLKIIWKTVVSVLMRKNVNSQK